MMVVLFVSIFHSFLLNESDTLVSAKKTMPESTDLESLAKSLKLVVPSSVKECRKAIQKHCITSMHFWAFTSLLVPDSNESTLRT